METVVPQDWSLPTFTLMSGRCTTPDEANVYQSISDCHDSIIPAFDCVRDFFFQDIDYAHIIGLVPIWIGECGISPESGISKCQYEQLRKAYQDPLINRFIHWFDVEFLLNSLMDRICSLEFFVREFFKIVPCIPASSTYSIDSAHFTISEMSMFAYAMVNSVFVNLASAFDLMAKVAVELAEYERNDFRSYKKMRSADIIYGKKVNVWDELKADKHLFHGDPDVRLIETLRNDYVHDRSWCRRAPIYFPRDKDSNLLTPFMPIPDYDEQGNYQKSGTRKKFYSQGKMVNQILPQLVVNVLKVLQNTSETMCECCRVRTDQAKDKTVLTYALIEKLRTGLKNYANEMNHSASAGNMAEDE